MPKTAPPPVKLKLNTRILPLISVLVFVLMLIDGYRGWAVLSIGLGGFWLISYYWARALANGLQIRREMRFGWAQVGDRLEERFTLINRARVPALWVEVIGQTNMPDYWANQVRSVEKEAETRWQIRGMCTRRGLYTLGPTTIQTNDPFGVYTVTVHDPASATLMVMPPVVPLPPIQVAPGGRAGEGTPRTNAPERTVSSARVRAYEPGDSLRWIHWPTSARRDEFFVRVFEGAPAGDWWILLDLDKNVQCGEEENATQEHGIILAASLADLGMRTGRSVGLVAHGENELIWHRPGMSDEAKWAILRSLALVEPGEVSLNELLELARPALGRNSSLIVITPAASGAWLEPLLAVRRTGAVPTLLLFDPLTFGGSEGVAAIQSDLAALGIPHEIIARSLLDRSEARPGREGDWGWRVTPLGKAVPTFSQEELSWRNLS